MTPSPSLRESDRVRVELGIERDLLQQLGRPAPLALVLHTLCEWVLIVGAIALASRVGNLWVSLAAVVLVGTRQHALLILMHEFSHRQFSRTRPEVNDALGDVLTALPLLVTVHGFRRDHIAHHRATSTADDPNWVSSIQHRRYRFPRSRASMAWLLFLHTIGAFAFQDVKGYLFVAKMATSLPSAVKLRQTAFWLAVAAISWTFNLWSVLAVYWFLPMFTVLMMLLYLRDVAEHHAMPAPGLEASRTTLSGPLESFLVAPHSAGCHAEHHLYPSVPFCRLRQLHRLLSARHGYGEHAVVTRGYFTGLLHEVAAGRQPGHGQPSLEKRSQVPPGMHW